MSPRKQCNVQRSLESANLCYICEICGFSVKTAPALATHRKKHSALEYSCFVCNEKFDSKITCRQHVEENHKNESRKVYSCVPPCEKTFENYKQFRTHCRYLHAEKVHRCDLCQKTFKRVDKLKLHLATHDKNRYDHLCFTCGKMFRRRDKLAEHERKKHNYKILESDAASLNNNNSLINVEQLCSYEMVPNEFSPLSNNTSVYECSNGEVFICNFCYVPFKRYGMFLKHVTTEHPFEYTPKVNAVLKRRTLYKCPQCDDLTFPNFARLTDHVGKIHPGYSVTMKKTKITKTIQTPTVKCPYCINEYVNKWKLHEHVKAKHHNNGAEEINNEVNRTFDERFESQLRHIEKVAEERCFEYERGGWVLLSTSPDDNSVDDNPNATTTNTVSWSTTTTTATTDECSVVVIGSCDDVVVVSNDEESSNSPSPFVRPMTAIPVEPGSCCNDNVEEFSVLCDNPSNSVSTSFNGYLDIGGRGPVTPYALVGEIPNNQVLVTPKFTSNNTTNNNLIEAFGWIHSSADSIMC